jgi:hypothetical protein
LWVCQVNNRHNNRILADEHCASSERRLSVDEVYRTRSCRAVSRENLC